MNRRNFLKLTASAAAGMLVVPGFLYASSAVSVDDIANDNILVFIQLNGGNDGLNMFVPFDDPLYYFNRPTIGVSKEAVINAMNGLGFHPSLKDMATISQDGNLTILQNVGYPNPNRSHFRSIEIWQTASDSNKYLNHGWLGRFLDIQCKDDHLSSLNIDAIDNLALKSPGINGITIKDFNVIKKMMNQDETVKFSDNPQLDFVRKISFASTEGIVEINKALANAKNYNETYANNGLSKNLEWISKLVKGKMSSKVYYTSLSGFDTHNNQLQKQSNLFKTLNDAVYSFYKDMKANNLLDRVTLVVFSEFGRRVKENGTGTDHGTSGPMMIIGGKNKGQIIGKNPNLEQLNNGDMQFETDFRSVYATLLKEKYGFDASKIGINQSIVPGLF